MVEGDHTTFQSPVARNVSEQLLSGFPNSPGGLSTLVLGCRRRTAQKLMYDNRAPDSHNISFSAGLRAQTPIYENRVPDYRAIVSGRSLLPPFYFSLGEFRKLFWTCFGLQHCWKLIYGEHLGALLNGFPYGVKRKSLETLSNFRHLIPYVVTPIWT